MLHDIFISYSRKDSAQALELAELLRAVRLRPGFHASLRVRVWKTDKSKALDPSFLRFGT